MWKEQQSMLTKQLPSSLLVRDPHFWESLAPDDSELIQLSESNILFNNQIYPAQD